MGADVFMNRGRGKDAKDAFRKIIEEDQYENGHRSYSGTISQKRDFVTITVPGVQGLPTPEVAASYANKLIDDEDRRIDDKWGPAGCIEVQPDKGSKERLFLFFGWASS